MRHSLAALLFALCGGACSQSGSSQTDAGPVDAGISFAGSVTLIGGVDPSGVAVMLTGKDVTRMATTGADGSYGFSGLSAGPYSLAFAKSASLPANAGSPVGAKLEYAGAIPSLTVGPDGRVSIQDANASYPFAPIELPAGRELLASNTADGATIIVSSDTSHVAFLTDEDANGYGTLWLAPLPGGAAVKVAAGVGPRAFDFSPDSTLLVYLADEDANGNGTLTIAPVSGGNAVQVGTDVYSFDVARQGGHLAFLANADANGIGTLELTTLAGGAPMQVATSAGDYWFSKDDTRLAVISGATFVDNHTGYAGTLEIVSAATGQSTTVSTNVFDSYDDEFSADGSHFAFLANKDANGHGTLELATVPGAAITTVSQGVGVGSFNLTADSARLVFGTGDNGGSLFTAAIANPTPVLVASGTGYSRYVVSPDGSELAFTTGVDANRVGTLEVTALANPSPVPVAMGVGLDVDFSPDSRSLAFLTNQDMKGNGTLELSAVANPSPMQLGTNVVYAQVTFSPDSSRVAFLTGVDANGNGTLDVAKTADGSVTMIAPATSWYAFSPDSNRLVLLGNSDAGGAGTLEVAAVAGGSPVELNKPIISATVAGQALVAIRRGTATPFSFQNGVYSTALP